MSHAIVHDAFQSAKARRLSVILSSIYIAAIILFVFGIKAIIADSSLRLFLFLFGESLLLCSYLSAVKARLDLALILFFLTAWQAIFIANITFGGSESLVMCWWVIFVCLAGLLGGRHYSLAWGVVAFVSVVVLWCLNRWMPDMASFVVEEDKTVQVRTHLLAQLVIAIAIVQSFLSVSSKYERQIEDYTSQLEAEVEKRRLAEEDALESQKVTVQFFANMGHELRTPLNCIVGFSSHLLKRETLFEERDRSALERINSNAQALSKLINEMFELSSISLIRLKYSSEPFLLEELICECVEVAEPVAHEYGLDIKFVYEETASIYADRVRLHQAILNVIYFSIRQTDEGIISLEMKLSSAEGIPSVVLTILDSSMGIAPEYQEGIFESHYQYILNSNKNLPISALALVISSKLITMHQGSISVDSEISKGARFTIALPLKPS